MAQLEISALIFDYIEYKKTTVAWKQRKHLYVQHTSVRASLNAVGNILIFCCCNRGASGHVTRDNFPFNQTLISSILIEILHRAQWCALESTSSQYLGHLSC